MKNRKTIAKKISAKKVGAKKQSAKKIPASRKPPHFDKSHQLMLQQLDSPSWVKDMHLFREQNGFFRTEDLQKVLGDPRDKVEISPIPALPFVAKG